jgi:hypothetical protein
MLYKFTVEVLVLLLQYCRDSLSKVCLCAIDTINGIKLKVSYVRTEKNGT